MEAGGATAQPKLPLSTFHIIAQGAGGRGKILASAFSAHTVTHGGGKEPKAKGQKGRRGKDRSAKVEKIKGRGERQLISQSKRTRKKGKIRDLRTWSLSFLGNRPVCPPYVCRATLPPPESMAAIQSQRNGKWRKGGSVRICPRRRRRRRKRNCPGQKEEEEEEVVGEVVSLLSPSIFLSSPAPAKK